MGHHTHGLIWAVAVVDALGLDPQIIVAVSGWLVLVTTALMPRLPHQRTFQSRPCTRLIIIYGSTSVQYSTMLSGCGMIKTCSEREQHGQWPSQISAATVTFHSWLSLISIDFSATVDLG